MTLADARRVIAAAEKKAAEIGQPMNIAVVDEGGNLVSHVRMDGAWLGSIDISINKAFTSRAFDISTKDLSTVTQPGQDFYGIHVSNHGRIMIFAGGIPLKKAAKSSAPSASAEVRAFRIMASPKPAPRRSSYSIPISLSSRSAWYTLRSASTIPWLATWTDRACSSV